MNKVPPSRMIRQEIDELLTTGVADDRNVLATLAELGLRYVAQQALEQDQTDFLGRNHYERSTEQRGYRNGYEDKRVKTAEGEVRLRVPQVRDAVTPFRPRLLDFLEDHSDVLERLVVEMYARGLSTRDVEDCFKDATGELVISKSAVSGITDQLWEDYQAFCTRDLSDIDVCYLFLDGIYESLRRYGAKEGILAAWAITSTGAKVLLHLGVGNKESERCWTEFLRNMIGRGLRIPISITGDGAPGLINAIGKVFPDSLRIRCWFHKLQNIRAKLPDDEAAEVMRHVRRLRDAPSLEVGYELAASVIEQFGDRFPSAMRCLADDLDASLAHLRLPARHQINVRTTNLLERTFEEERRRSKVIPRFLNEKSAMKLVFATMIRVSGRWRPVPFTQLDHQQLRLLRAELFTTDENESGSGTNQGRRRGAA